MWEEGRLVGSTVCNGFASCRREETARGERSQRQLKLAWLGHSGAFPLQVSLWPWFCSRTLISFALGVPYLLLEKQ